MIRNSLIFLAVIFLTFSAAFAQEDDTTAVNISDSTGIISAKKIDELSKIAISCDIDTGLFSLHFYNPVYRESFSPQFLGNTGSAFQNNIFASRKTQSPFVFANPYLLYYHNPYNRLHFNTRRPFTQISYLTSGSKEVSEQLLSATHTQNFNPHANMGVEYSLISSRGKYLRQDLRSIQFSVFGSYDKDNYSVYSNISRNQIKSFENGGLISPQDFLVHQAKDPIAYGMNLDNAASANKNLSLFATQSYRFKKNISYPDSLTTDSAATKKEKNLPFMINHTFRYDRYTKLYRDEISETDTMHFYENNYYNSSTASDSAFRHVLENSFQISGDEYKFLPGFILGVKHQFTGYSYLYPKHDSILENSVFKDTILPSDFNTAYNNLSVYAMLLFNKKSKITYQGKFEYFFAGYRMHDILTDFSLNYRLNSKGARLSAFGSFYATEPDFFLKQYSSSHFQWDNTFPKTTATSAFLSLSSGNGTMYAEGGITLLGNYIYMNDKAVPAKADNAIVVSSFLFVKKFVWGGFNHIHKFALQTLNNEKVLQIPLFAYTNSSYYENAFFKSVLKFQIGFDFYYNTSYYGDTWMPATGMFYRQDIARIGNYPLFDAFLNWKIKRTRFFLKYVNALDGLAGYNYFTTYGYPLNPGSLKFGLSWTFYD